MINWLNQEEGFCEGQFETNYFKHDENDGEIFVYAKSPDLAEAAERCVEEFNNLTEDAVNEICKEILRFVKENDLDKEMDLPKLDKPTDILNYCWFTSMYINMLNNDDENAYVIEGEGDWGDVIGFFMEKNKLVYVGVDYMDYMKEE